MAPMRGMAGEEGERGSETGAYQTLTRDSQHLRLMVNVKL